MAPMRLAVPRDYLLARDVCSYGYFLLEPNLWVPGPHARATRAGTFKRVLDLPGGPVTVTITQPGGKGTELVLACSRTLQKADKQVLTRQLTRMLRLDEPAETLRAFHKLDPRWKKSGRGRLFRSPTLFEDVIKTITSCNVAWPSTIRMNRRLCEVFGREGAFPTAEALADQRPASLRAQCGVGYRDGRIVEMAKLFATGQVDPAWFEDPTHDDETIRERLIELPGIGPYAAANILQLLGRFGHLPLDTESVRHGRVVLKMRGSSKSIMKRVARTFEPFGEHKFRSYWFELWQFYEAKRGPSHTWERETTGKTFTAAMLEQ
jgi:3-methyladenine DNA glycosylase/8-oxoguanine DNA glycosylase